jgi:hypothetical protein
MTCIFTLEDFVQFLARGSSRVVPAALLMLAAACASGGDVGQLGDYAAYTPTLTTVEGQTRPSTVNVSLANPAFAVVLFVIPGRGATLIYPADTGASNYLTAGTHTLTTSFSDRSKLVDTSFLPRPQNDSTRRRAQNTQPAARFDISALEREGYLLLVTSADSLRAGQIARRIDGVTIPIEDDAALNAVSKLVIGSNPRSASWAAFYRLVQVK